MINFALYVPAEGYFRVYCREPMAVDAARFAAVSTALQECDDGEYVVAFDDDPEEWMGVFEPAHESRPPLSPSQLGVVDSLVRSACFTLRPSNT